MLSLFHNELREFCAAYVGEDCDCPRPDLNNLMDSWYLADEERLEANRIAKAKTSIAEALKQQVLALLAEQNLTGAGGQYCFVKVKMKEVPSVTDWQKLYEYIKEFDAFDLLHKRVGIQAVNLREADGIIIPGLETIEVPTLTKSKVS